MMIEHQTQIVALALIAWTIGLVVVLILYRTRVVMLTKKPTNSFSPSGDDLTAFGERLTRSYVNCTEFVPFILGILLYAIATDQTDITDGLALYVLMARIGHSSLHIASTGPVVIGVRSLLFWAQITISLFWILRLASSFL